MNWFLRRQDALQPLPAGPRPGCASSVAGQVPGVQGAQEAGQGPRVRTHSSLSLQLSSQGNAAQAVSPAFFICCLGTLGPVCMVGTSSASPRPPLMHAVIKAPGAWCRPSSAECSDCQARQVTGCDHSKDARFLEQLHREVQRVNRRVLLVPHAAGSSALRYLLPCCLMGRLLFSEALHGGARDQHGCGRLSGRTHLCLGPGMAVSMRTGGAGSSCVPRGRCCMRPGRGGRSPSWPASGAARRSMRTCAPLCFRFTPPFSDLLHSKMVQIYVCFLRSSATV